MTPWSRRRKAAVVLGIGVLLAPTHVHAEGEPGSGLSSYKLIANAPGIALEGLYRDVALTVPEVTSSLTTGNVGAGLASVAWPGPILGNAGSTILVLSPQAPPQVTMLNDPVRAESRTAGPQTASNSAIPGTTMTSSAKPDEVTAQVATGTPTQLPVGTLGALTSSSRVAFTGATAAVGEAKSTVQQLTLAGGAISIGSLQSSATATTDGRIAQGKGTTVVSGMTIGGVPVTVDASGVHAAGQNVPAAVPQDALNNAIRALGLEVHLTQPTVTKTGGSVDYSSGALILIYHQGASQYALTLGRASVSLAATTAMALSTPTVAIPAAPTSSGAVHPGATGAGALPSGDTGVTPQGSPANTPMVAAPPAAQVVPVAYALADGVPAPLVVLGLLAAALLAFGLRRLPDRVLALSTTDCDERLS